MAKKAKFEDDSMDVADFLAAHNLATNTIFQCFAIALDRSGLIDLEDLRSFITDVSETLTDPKTKDQDAVRRIKMAKTLMGDLVNLLEQVPPVRAN